MTCGAGGRRVVERAVQHSIMKTCTKHKIQINTSHANSDRGSASARHFLTARGEALSANAAGAGDQKVAKQKAGNAVIISNYSFPALPS